MRDCVGVDCVFGGVWWRASVAIAHVASVVLLSVCDSRLLHAAPEQRLKFEISQNGLHWSELDEDISIAGLLSGTGDLTRPE